MTTHRRRCGLAPRHDRVIPRLESLEGRLAPATDITPIEQYALELINRDRMAPAAAAAGYGVDLNEGLPAGTVTADPKDPLAPDQSLLAAIRGHVAYLSAAGLFTHVGAGGTMPWDRVGATGFYGLVSENIARITGGLSEASVAAAHRALFVDAGFAGRGHRVTLLDPALRSGAAAVAVGGGDLYLGQELGGRDDGAVFLTGVVYADANGDVFYNPAEAIGGVTVRATDVATGAVVEEAVSPAGSYALRLAPGSYRVEVIGAGVGGTRVAPEPVGVGGRSVKLDFLADRGAFKLGNAVLGPSAAPPVAPQPAAAVVAPPAAPAVVVTGPGGFAVGSGVSGVARLFNTDTSGRFTADVFPGYAGGVRVAAADFTGDGVADLAAGTGPGAPSHVRVLDGTTGYEVFALAPFEAAFVGGVSVAAGDINGDGLADLVVTPDEGGGPRVRVFDARGFVPIADFLGIEDPAFRGGARAAVGDFNGDGAGDLVVAAGFGGGPRIAVFDGRSVAAGAAARLFGDFFLFEPSLRDGAYVTAGDVDGDGRADLIGGGGPGGGPRVLGLSGTGLLTGGRVELANFFAGDPAGRGGVRVALKDFNGDGRADLLAGAGSAPWVAGYPGMVEAFAFDAFPGSTGGVYVG